MGKNDIDYELKCIEATDRFRVEAANMLIDAFNQGYLLGEQYAKQCFERSK